MYKKKIRLDVVIVAHEKWFSLHVVDKVFFVLVNAFDGIFILSFLS